MAKVTAPLHSSEARGRLGGICYNTWRGISTVKAQKAPCQPRTERQLFIRSIGVKLVRLWQNLTSAQRLTWNDYAPLHIETDGMGSPKRLSGLNWYTRLNSRLQQLSISPVSTAPATSAPGAPSSLVATGGSGQIGLAFTAMPTSLNFWIHDDGPHSPGRQGSFARAAFLTTFTTASTTATITGLAAGQHDLFVRAVSRTDGQASTWEHVYAQVT